MYTLSSVIYKFNPIEMISLSYSGSQGLCLLNFSQTYYQIQSQNEAKFAKFSYGGHAP